MQGPRNAQDGSFWGLDNSFPTERKPSDPVRKPEKKLLLHGTMRHVLTLGPWGFSVE